MSTRKKIREIELSVDATDSGAAEREPVDMIREILDTVRGMSLSPRESNAVVRTTAARRLVKLGDGGVIEIGTPVHHRTYGEGIFDAPVINESTGQYDFAIVEFRRGGALPVPLSELRSIRHAAPSAEWPRPGDEIVPD